MGALRRYSPSSTPNLTDKKIRPDNSQYCMQEGFDHGRPGDDDTDHVVRSRTESNPSAAASSTAPSNKRRDRRTVAPLGGSVGAPGVVPPEMSASRWAAVRKSGTSHTEYPELVDRKIWALLNKLTVEDFDSISDQIIDLANKSKSEKDGRTLIQVIRIVYWRAINDGTGNEIHARLCRRMMERISPEVQDAGVRNTEGKPTVGGQLFKKYLLNRCQEDFERGWVAKKTTAKAPDDQAVKAASEKGDESEPYSDEYYAAQKAKRRGLGLIKFIGELFKHQMLTERIVHECVKKLLGNPGAEDIESVCLLLKTVGQLLDVPKARAHMDVYFTRMKALCKSPDVSLNLQFLLQDVIELRDRKWVVGAGAVTMTLSTL